MTTLGINEIGPSRTPSGDVVDFNEIEKKKNDSYAGDVTRAYEDVFGRTPSQEEIDHQIAVQGITKFENYDDLVKGLSQSPEAQRKNVNPTDFGNVVATPDTLDENQLQYYNTALEFKDPNEIFTDEISIWAEFGKDPLAYKAALSGGIVHNVQFDEDGNASRQTFVTAEGIETMGGTFLQDGVDTGTAIFVPEGTSVSGDFWKKYDQQSTVGTGHPTIPEGTYDIYVAQGKPSGGLFGAIGDLTGIKEIEEFGEDLATFVPAEAALIAPFIPFTPLAPLTPFIVPITGDPFGITQGILFGDAGHEQTLKAYENLGINEESANEIMQFGASATAALLSPVAPPAAAAVLAADAARDASIGGADVGFAEVAPQLAAAYVQAFVPGIGVGQQALVQMGATAIAGGDTTDILIAGGSTFVSPILGSDDALGTLGTLAANTGIEVARGSDLEDALRTAGFNAVARAVGAALADGVTQGSLPEGERPGFGERVFDNLTDTGALFSDPTSIPGAIAGGVRENFNLDNRQVAGAEVPLFNIGPDGDPEVIPFQDLFTDYYRRQTIYNGTRPFDPERRDTNEFVVTT